MVSVLDFPSPELLAARLLAINASAAEYQRYLRWRTDDGAVSERYRKMIRAKRLSPVRVGW